MAALAFALLLPSVALVACSKDEVLAPGGGEPGECGATGPKPSDRFAGGSPDGHADPFGAKGAKAARAGRVRDESMAVLGQNPKGRVMPGDYVLANEHVAIYISGRIVTDGSLGFGGKIIAASPVGDDGRPLPTSDYGETLIGFSRQSLLPDSITVLDDGSAGGPAIVRASGRLANVPMIDGVASILNRETDLPAAFDYLLYPGESKLRIRVQLANTHDYNENFTDQYINGLLHVSRAQRFVQGAGFGNRDTAVPWVALETPSVAYGWKPLNGLLTPALRVGGIDMFKGTPPKMEACGKIEADLAELHIAPTLDALLEAVSAGTNAPAFRTVTVSVNTAGTGASKIPVPGAYVHITEDGDTYLTRAQTGADGTVKVRVPAGATKVYASTPGRAPVSAAVSDSSTQVALDFAAASRPTLRITEGAARIPARVQWLRANTKQPPSWGLREEQGSRVLVDYNTGNADPSYALDAGEYDLVVTHGNSYNAFTQRVTLVAGASPLLSVPLVRAVQRPSEMCADFHIHTKLSFDATDPVDTKIRAAVADDLQIPVQSEHEWVSSFQDRINTLGLSKYAFSPPSEEISTGAYGHFGIVPLYPDDKAPNRGAAPWQNKPITALFDWVAARPESPALIINHPLSPLGMGYFTAASFSMAEGKGLDATNWSEKFHAIEVFNDSDFDANYRTGVAAWFSLLSAGKTYWAVGNSDSHILTDAPVGYPRTCFEFGHNDPAKLTPEAVRDVLKAGAGVVDGGLRLTVEGPGGARPGATVKAAEGDFVVTIDSAAFAVPGELETYVDGTLYKTDVIPGVPLPNGGHRDQIVVRVTPTSSRARHYVVFHARGKAGTDLAPLNPSRKAFGVSNPVFLAP